MVELNDNTAAGFEQIPGNIQDRISQLESDLERVRSLLVAKERRLASSDVLWRGYFWARDIRAWTRVKRKVKKRLPSKRPVKASRIRVSLGRFVLARVSVESILAAKERGQAHTNIYIVTSQGDRALREFRFDVNAAVLDELTATLTGRCNADVEGRLDGRGDHLGGITFECGLARSTVASLEPIRD